MADNYSMSSFALPASWPEQAKDDFVYIMKSLADYETPKGYESLMNDLDSEIWLHGTVWDDKDTDADSSGDQRRVGYWDTDSFDVNNAVAVVQAIANRYKIPPEQSCYISWAYTCSKPVIDDFGGSEVRISCNKGAHG